MPFELSQESSFAVPVKSVWDQVRRMSSVNGELSPWVKMSYPGDDYIFSEAETEVNTFLFRSLILLFGFIPVDWHFVRMNEVQDERGFKEDSVSLTHKYWRHQRWIEPTPAGCVLKDEVVFLPRLPLIGHLLLPIYVFVFKHRHNRLVTILRESSDN